MYHIRAMCQGKPPSQTLKFPQNSLPDNRKEVSAGFFRQVNDIDPADARKEEPISSKIRVALGGFQGDFAP
jgi:hypothetical protein